MIMSMVNLSSEGRSILVAVLEPENLDRMKKADPITMESNESGGGLAAPMFPQNFSVLIAYEEDQEKLYSLARSAGEGWDGVREFISYLERGRVFIEGVDGVQNVRKL
jgi:hypothetical protein